MKSPAFAPFFWDSGDSSAKILGPSSTLAMLYPFIQLRLITSIWRERGYSNIQRRIDEEQAAKIITDSSVDHKRYMVYIDSIKRESEKAILARVGHWRSKMTREGWLPKSQVEFMNGHEALLPVWLARKFGYTISTDSMLYD